jgi:AcrR family transcriptional regulator
MSPCTEPDPAAFARLSPKQAQAATALARGATVTRVADALGIHRSTIYYWFKSDSLFRKALTELHREREERLRDEMRELEFLALSTLRDILQDPCAPAGVRLRAAMAVITRPSSSLGGEDWRLPQAEPIDRALERCPDLAGPFSFAAGRHRLR